MSVRTKLLGGTVVAALAVAGLTFYQDDGKIVGNRKDERRDVVYSANWSLNIRGDVQWGRDADPAFRKNVKPPFQEHGTAAVGERVTVAVSLEFATRRVDAFRCWVTVNNEVHTGEPYRDAKHCVVSVVVK